MSISLPEFPYGYGALEPAMSRDTLWFHFAQHERACYEPTIVQVRGTELDGLDLETLIQVTAGAPSHRSLHFHAAELWNHNFFWKCMRPNGGGPATGLIAECIRAHFGSYDDFLHEFTSAAMSVAGNGWLWLMWEKESLHLLMTSNSDTPIADGRRPVLALDLWEHAYYLDHQNRRSAYVATFLEELVDWDFADRNLQRCWRACRAPAGWRGDYVTCGNAKVG